jgi:hypothetical protein
MVEIDIPGLSDNELARLLAALQCEDAVRLQRRVADKLKSFADTLVQVDPDSAKYRWHITRGYIYPTHRKRFQGGFFVRPKATNAEMYAKTKTGVLYVFNERYRKWEKV